MNGDFIKTCQFNTIPPLYLAVNDKTVQFFAYADFIIGSHGILEIDLLIRRVVDKAQRHPISYSLLHVNAYTCGAGSAVSNRDQKNKIPVLDNWYKSQEVGLGNMEEFNTKRSDNDRSVWIWKLNKSVIYFAKRESIFDELHNNGSSCRLTIVESNRLSWVCQTHCDVIICCLWWLWQMVTIYVGPKQNCEIAFLTQYIVTKFSTTNKNNF